MVGVRLSSRMLAAKWLAVCWVHLSSLGRTPWGSAASNVMQHCIRNFGVLDAVLHAFDVVCLDVVHAFFEWRAAMLLGERSATDKLS